VQLSGLEQYGPALLQAAQGEGVSRPRLEPTDELKPIWIGQEVLGLTADIRHQCDAAVAGLRPRQYIAYSAAQRGGRIEHLHTGLCLFQFGITI
jgi:hypothetical protein